MKKFAAIEGLRGWLAWTVVLAHLSQTSNIHAKGLGPEILKTGQFSVLIFVIISGFVITHLVTEKPEPYADYLIRRFMRIFPLFSVTCIVGYFTNDLLVDVASRVPWAEDKVFATWASAVARSNHEFLFAHALAHLTMLHGAISDNILPFSQYAFNAPAWSLSLEWQFYLVAPFVVKLAHERRAILAIAIVTACLGVAYNFGVFGSFESPSLLPAAAGYFAVGIASRLVYPRVAGSVQHPFSIAAVLVTLVPLGWPVVPILVWGIILIGLLSNRENLSTFTRAYRAALESPLAKYFGTRSYSIYLCHYPIIAISHWLWLGMFPNAMQAATFFGISAMVLPFTLAASEFLYRSIEQPGIAVGSRIVRWKKRPAIA